MNIIHKQGKMFSVVAACLVLSYSPSMVWGHGYKPQSCSEQMANAKADARLAKPEIRFQTFSRDKLAAWNGELVHCPRGEISLRNHEIPPQCRTPGSGFIPSYDPAPVAVSQELGIPSKILWHRFLHSCDTVLIGY